MHINRGHSCIIIHVAVLERGSRWLKPQPRASAGERQDADRFPDRAGALSPLEARRRRRRRHAADGRRREGRAVRRLRAQAQFLRSRRRHRAGRRASSGCASSIRRCASWCCARASRACSAPAPISACWPAPRHAHKVNFCKFTNETRNGIEDSSEHSGLKTICAINGTAAGGGYELALAADHIMLVDDGSSSVSLPELPLLAVLPGTGGLTRVTDKRKVRRDHADVFCTTEEGVKGKRAVDWRLVDEVVPGSKFDDAVDARAPRNSPRNRGAQRRRQGHQAHAAARATFAPTASNTARSSVEFDRARAARHHHVARARRAAAAHRPTPWWRRARSSGRCGSRASSTTRSSTSALNELDIAAIVFKSSGDAGAGAGLRRISSTPTRIIGWRAKSGICGSACSSASISPRARW